jgi:hypothetical protein
MRDQQVVPALTTRWGNGCGRCRKSVGAVLPYRQHPGRADCLEQMLLAFRDIADRDDIHQAAARLAVVQEWIRLEAERAAADPVFAELQMV